MKFWLSKFNSPVLFSKLTSLHVTYILFRLLIVVATHAIDLSWHLHADLTRPIQKCEEKLAPYSQNSNCLNNASSHKYFTHSTTVSLTFWQSNCWSCPNYGRKGWIESFVDSTKIETNWLREPWSGAQAVCNGHREVARRFSLYRI